MVQIIQMIHKTSPEIVDLPDGDYKGIWGGYVIEIEYKNTVYYIRTEDGVRGMGVNVVVHVKDGVATFNLFKNI